MSRPEFYKNGTKCWNTLFQWFIFALMFPAAILAVGALPLVGLMVLLDWTDDLRVKKFCEK